MKQKHGKTSHGKTWETQNNQVLGSELLVKGVPCGNSEMISLDEPTMLDGVDPYIKGGILEQSFELLEGFYSTVTPYKIPEWRFDGCYFC